MATGLPKPVVEGDKTKGEGERSIFSSTQRFLYLNSYRSPTELVEERESPVDSGRVQGISSSPRRKEDETGGGSADKGRRAVITVGFFANERSKCSKTALPPKSRLITAADVVFWGGGGQPYRRKGGEEGALSIQSEILSKGIWSDH